MNVEVLDAIHVGFCYRCGVEAPLESLMVTDSDIYCVECDEDYWRQHFDDADAFGLIGKPLTGAKGFQHGMD